MIQQGNIVYGMILFSRGRTTMATKPYPLSPWETRVKLFLKAELARADIGYRELAERLAKYGLKETDASIENKINRATFSATFLLATLKAIGADVIRLEAV
jgi:Domain of unknown function (DUF6471)